MAGKSYIQRMRERVTPDVERFTELKFNFVDAVIAQLEVQGMTQKNLAKKLNKSESEVSKWLTGTHNLTFRTVAKIEAALGVEILYCARSLHFVSSSSQKLCFATKVGPSISYNQKAFHKAKGVDAVPKPSNSNDSAEKIAA